MLTSEPPHLIIDGVSIFTDHALKNQLYYLPVMPHFQTTNVNGNALPMFSLIEFSDGAETSGGLLNFTTSLGVEPERLAEIAAQAQQALELDSLPRLSPVPMIDGTAHLILMGKTSADNEDDALIVDTTFDPVAEDGSTNRFVRHMSHPAKPSLYGDQNAAFSAELDKEGAMIMRQALDGIIIPAAVMYSLTFASLRKAYNVSVSADWERVQKHLEEKFGANVLVFSSSIEKTVDELVEEQLITITADTFVTAEDEDASLISNKDQALKRVQDMVTETFFTPTLNPWKPAKDGWDRALDAVERLAHINPMGSEDALFSFNRVDYTRIDQKKLNASFSERSAIRRTIYPQAHLNGLVDELTESGLTLDDVVKRVRLNDPWYESRRLEVINRADFQRDGITSIRVEMDYEGSNGTVVFDETVAANETEAVTPGLSQTASQPKSWPSRVDGDEMVLPVSVTYQVDFNDIETTRGIGRVQAPVSVINGEVVEIDPVGDGLYKRHIVTASVAAEFPWDRYSAIDVWFGHRLESGLIEDHAHERIVPTRESDTEQASDVSYAYTTLPDQPDTCLYKVVYRGSQSGDIAVPWQAIDGDFAPLNDPFPAKRRVAIVGALNWSDYNMVFVDMEMHDESGQVSVRESFELNASNKSATFVADLINPALQEVDYRITAIKTDGSVVQTETSVTLDARIIIDERMSVKRLVQVSLETDDFDAARIEEVKIRMTHDDLANGLRASEEFTFSTADDSAYFAYEFVDNDAEVYQVEIESRSTTGNIRFLPEPIRTSSRKLALRLP